MVLRGLPRACWEFYGKRSFSVIGVHNDLSASWKMRLYGRGAMTARGWLLAAVAALAARPLAAYPSHVDCSRSIRSGTIMGHSISTNGAPAEIQLALGGITIPCGSALMAGDTGLTLVKGFTGSESQYLIEAEMSAGTGSWGIISGSCSMQRAANRCYTKQWSRAGVLRAESQGACVCMCDWHACTHHTVAHGDANHRLISCCWFVCG